MCTYFAEGIQVLEPQFLALPEAFVPLMDNLVRDYLQARAQIGREPDAELLREVMAAFTTLGSR